MDGCCRQIKGRKDLTVSPWLFIFLSVETFWYALLHSYGSQRRLTALPCPPCLHRLWVPAVACPWFSSAFLGCLLSVFCLWKNSFNRLKINPLCEPSVSWRILTNINGKLLIPGTHLVEMESRFSAVTLWPHVCTWNVHPSCHARKNK